MKKNFQNHLYEANIILTPKCDIPKFLENKITN